MLLALAAGVLLTACGDGGSDGDATEAGPSPRRVDITASDYGFEAPETTPGGIVELSFRNTGREAHFAGLARVAPGRTFDDVRAALTAPPPTPAAGPPPFEEVAGMPTTDPKKAATMTVNLPPGTYALFCLIPSSDGVTHAAKGMVKQLTVTEGAQRASLPVSGATVTGTDFSLTGLPPVAAGTNVVRLRNGGGQLHEINLVELPSGVAVDDVIAWYRRPAGLPPMTSLGGVAVKPGEEGTARLDLRRGATYAFVCALPDVLGDFAPHVTKGMFTPAFTVD